MIEGLVVICIPAYNHADKLARLLRSVDEQDYDNKRVIIADDSTCNDIYDYIRGWQKDYITYVRNESSLGATGNTNKILTLAMDFKPEYVKIMHQDDYFSYPYSLSKMVEGLSGNKDANILFSAFYQENAEKERRSVTASDTDLEYLKQDWKYIYKRNFLFGPSNTLIRNTGNALFLDDRLVFLIDVDFYLRTLKDSREFVYEKDELITNEVGDYQLSDKCTSTPHLISEEILYIYDKYPELHETKYEDWAYNKICSYELKWFKSVDELDRYREGHATEGAALLERVAESVRRIKNHDLKKIIIYGLGSVFKDNIAGIEQLRCQDRVSAFMDQRPNDSFGKYKVYQPDAIQGLSYDAVIITSVKYYHEIKAQLCGMHGVEEERIMPPETVYMMHLI